MSARFGVTLSAAVLALATAAAHMAPTTTGAARTDAAGDPLPPDVIARLGSTRLFQDGVCFLAFSPDDKILASADTAGTCILWDVSTGKEVRRCELPYRPGAALSISSLAFSADSKLIAVGVQSQSNRQNEIHIWEIATGKERCTFGEISGCISELAFDPHGRYLAGGGYGGPIHVWDLEKNGAIGSWGDDTLIRGLAFSDDGKTLCARVSDTTNQYEALVGYEVSSTKELWRRKCDRDLNGRLIGGGALFAERDAKGLAFRLVDTASGKEVCHTEDAAGGQSLELLAEAGGRLLTVSGIKTDRTVRVWDCATGKLVREFKPAVSRLWRGALSHDGKLVAMTSILGGPIHIWDAAKDCEVHAFPGHRNGSVVVAFSADGKTVYTANGERGHTSTPPDEWAEWSLRQWDAKTGKELRVTVADPGGEVSWSTFCPDGRLLAVVINDGTLRLWDTAAGKELRTWKVPTRTVTVYGVKYPFAAYPPRFSADGDAIFVAAEGVLHCWDVRTGKELPAVAAPMGNDFERVFPSANSGTVVVSGFGPPSTTRLNLVDAASGHLIRTVGTFTFSAPIVRFLTERKNTRDGGRWWIGAVGGGKWPGTRPVPENP
jgi:WD40 repeat protein